MSTETLNSLYHEIIHSEEYKTCLLTWKVVAQAFLKANEKDNRERVKTTLESPEKITIFNHPKKWVKNSPQKTYLGLDPDEIAEIEMNQRKWLHGKIDDLLRTAIAEIPLFQKHFPRIGTATFSEILNGDASSYSNMYTDPDLIALRRPSQLIGPCHHKNELVDEYYGLVTIASETN